MPFGRVMPESSRRMLAPRPTKLRSQRDINLWRIPLQLSLAATALFGITLIPDILDKLGVIHIPSWLTMGSIDDARAILSAMMGAVATVLALIFSVALLVLSMVATLFGPRLLYGHVIVDECHHLTAFSFEQVMRQVKAKFIVGLTATPSRKDGHHPIIFMQCGPIRFNLSAREAAERSPFRHLVLPRPTGFRVSPEVTDLTIHDAYAALVASEERNRQIVGDILQSVREGRSPLVLTNRTDHI
jgi:hypothetical protein